MSAKKLKSTVLLVDDHPIVRQGLAELIDHEKDLSVSGMADCEDPRLDLASWEAGLIEGLEGKSPRAPRELCPRTCAD